MTETRRVGLYCRVSTKLHQSTADQEYRLLAWAKGQGWEVEDLYIDHGISGRKNREQRPALDRLLRDAAQRKIDAIAITKFDRFFRNLRHLLNTIAELEKFGVELISLDDDVNTGTPIGRMQIAVIGAMAEFFADRLAENIREGQARAVREGKTIGRPRIARSIELRVVAMLDAHVPISTIARETGVSRDTVYRIQKDFIK